MHVSIYAVDKLMAETRRLAAEYRRVTGQPLPVTSEIAKYDAARLLDLEPVNEPPQGAGYDAIGRSGEWQGRRVQVKGRAVFEEIKSNQRIGQLKLEQEWDCVVLVLLDEELEPFEVYAADRADILDAIGDGDRRNKRGAMTVAKFKIIAQLVWTREEGVIEDEVWDNYGNN